MERLRRLLFCDENLLLYKQLKINELNKISIFLRKKSTKRYVGIEKYSTFAALKKFEGLSFENDIVRDLIS